MARAPANGIEIEYATYGDSGAEPLLLVHGLGLSNGGAIAQLMAIRHPQQVASLVSMMATSGRRGLPRPTKEAQAWLNRPANSQPTLGSVVQDALDSAALLGSPGYPRDEAALRQAATRDFHRGHYPAGTSRHLLASLASGDSRVAQLADIACPTLVIHGELDPLVPLAQGEDVCNSIPGAELLVIKGMAHDVPDAAVAQIVQGIVANAQRHSERGHA